MYASGGTRGFHDSQPIGLGVRVVMPFSSFLARQAAIAISDFPLCLEELGFWPYRMCCFAVLLDRPCCSVCSITASTHTLAALYCSDSDGPSQIRVCSHTTVVSGFRPKSFFFLVPGKRFRNLGRGPFTPQLFQVYTYKQI